MAVQADDAALTYHELSDAASALAGRLRELGVGPGDRVGVRVSSGTTELYVAILGALTAGAAYVPVDADDPPARAAEIWQLADACAVIEDDLIITELATGGGRTGAPTVDDDAWVIFTSGSTGRPKGVAVTHRAAAALVDAEARLWSLGPEDRVLAGLSVAFDASCEEMWLAWRHGAALVPAPRAIVRSGAELGPWLADHRITVVSTVPTLAALWDEAFLADVRLLILGGEACPKGLAWRLAKGRELWNTYGPTEAAVVSTAARIRPGDPVTIGWPLDGWQIAVVDAAGEAVPLGEPGELVISGVGLGRYLDPALDAKGFAELTALRWDRAYRTGDVVRETINGLEFLGRRDDQVKLGGRRVELGEVDAQLTAAVGVKAAAAALRRTAAGNTVLVGYVVGDVEPTAVRAEVAERLPAGIVPLIVVLDSLPRGISGKVDRKALPWPPPAPAANGTAPGATDAAGALTGTAAWLGERWADQLGHLPLTAESHFFELGGSSMAVAKLVSVLRSRFPSVAVADVYDHPRLGELAARLERLGEAGGETRGVPTAPRRRWGAVQLAGVIAVLALAAPQWVIGILAVNHVGGNQLGPQIGLGWLIAGWLMFTSAPGRALIVVVARRALLGGLKPGRYPRHSWLACRLWFVERVAEVFRLNKLAGTPWAPRYARLSGHEVGAGVSLKTLPPPASLIRIGEGATLEADVDVHGWWIEGAELVVGELRIGAGARIGMRALLMPGAEVGQDAEVEPGTVVTGRVPAGERWSGSPARHVGQASEGWPEQPAPAPRARRLWRAMYAAALGVETLLPVAASLPALALIAALSRGTQMGVLTEMIITAPLIVASFFITYALLVALFFRAVSRLVRPGWHADEGGTAWALWFSQNLLEGASSLLFPLYSSLLTRPWLRLLGIPVGRGTEMSHATTLTRLTSLGETSFGADEPGFATARLRRGWLHVDPIQVGNGTFLGNGALLTGGTRLGDHSLVGVLSSAPKTSADGSSWFGHPPLELPRVPDEVDPARTTNPPRRLFVGRGAAELVRILLPGSLSVMLAALAFTALDAIGTAAGPWIMIVAAPFVVLAGGLCAAALTIALKWLVMGRYRPGNHPFWSFFVWRDEIINSCQEQLAGAWLLRSSLGTPVIPAYLRAMGARVGSDVWCETLAITEFDLVDLHDGCVVNRLAHVQTHLFQDRLLRIGPTTLEAGSTLGPSSAVLPDTRLGAGCSVGGRSVVLRGEELPAGTRWHGAPVVGV